MRQSLFACEYNTHFPEKVMPGSDATMNFGLKLFILNFVAAQTITQQLVRDVFAETGSRNTSDLYRVEPFVFFEFGRTVGDWRRDIGYDGWDGLCFVLLGVGMAIQRYS